MLAKAEKQPDEFPAQTILDSMDVRMAILDIHGNICATNEAWKRQAQETCTTAEQFERTGIGVNYLEICQQAQGTDADEAPEALAGIKAVLQGTQPSFTMEYPCFSPTQENWYLLQTTPLPHNQGAVVAHIDITERKLFEQQKDTFIGMAAHELRTPLTALKGLVQLEKKKHEKQSIEANKRVMEKIDTQVDRLTNLVAELLDVSKMQAGTLDYAEDLIDVDALIKETVEMEQQTHPDYSLIIYGLPTHAALIGDWNKLCQVFTNLLSNAIKYSPHTNTVEISLETSDDTLLIHIQDHGTGIPHIHLAHIFERFYRADMSRRNHPAGLGLGLYIAREIVRHHQGAITVTSEEGKGSTFSVQLPLYKA